MTGPFAEGAPVYADTGLGWTVPIPYNKKSSPPTGYTGRKNAGREPSRAQIEDWIAERGGDNIALWPAPNVLIVDGDLYKKDGSEFDYVLPPTYRVTARPDDRLSGHYYYRVPPGLGWHEKLAGENVQLLHYGHRYAMLPPSTNPDADGAMYRWYGPDGTLDLAPTSVADLPELPPELVLRFSTGEATEAATAGLDDAAAEDWLAGRPDPDGSPCDTLRARAKAYAAELITDSDGAHPVLTPAVMELVWLAHEGHSGIRTALGYVERAFYGTATDRSRKGHRSRQKAEAEYARSLHGAVDTAAAREDPADGCDCGEEIGRLPESVRGDSAPRFVLVSAAELARPVPPMRWLVKGVWPEKSHGVLAGAKKSLKSWNALALAVAVASGQPYLGKFDVIQTGPVLIYNAEGGQDEFQRRYQRICEAYGVDPSSLPLSVTFDVGALNGAPFRDSLRAHLDALQPVLVILDPLYTYHPAGVEAQNLYERGRMLGELSRSVGHDSALTVVDHYRKTGAGTLDLDEIGQSGMAQWADSWVLQSHRELPDLVAGSFKLATEFGSRRWGGRRWDIDWECPFDFELGEPAGEISWTVEPHAGTGSGSRSTLADVEVLIIEAIDTAGGWMQKTPARFAARKVAEANGVKFSNDRFAEAWVSLVSDGRLTEESRSVQEGNRSVNRSGARTSSPEAIKLNGPTRPERADELPGDAPW
jgi:hypothetical protein